MTRLLQPDISCPRQEFGLRTPRNRRQMPQEVDRHTHLPTKQNECVVKLLSCSSAPGGRCVYRRWSVFAVRTCLSGGCDIVGPKQLVLVSKEWAYGQGHAAAVECADRNTGVASGRAFVAGRAGFYVSRSFRRLQTPASCLEQGHRERGALSTRCYRFAAGCRRCAECNSALQAACATQRDSL